MKKHLLPIIFIIITGFFIYGATLRFPYHWDDYRTIVDNPALSDPLCIHDIFLFWPSRTFLFWTFALNNWITDYGLPGYHLTNIIIHLSAAMVLYLLIYRTLNIRGIQTERRDANPELGKEYAWVALIASLLFSCHPIATGAVTYLIQRGVLLASGLGLLGLLIYTYARDHFFRVGVSFFNPVHLLSYGLIFIFLFLAMLSKEGALVIPFILIGWELIFCPPDGKFRSRLLYSIPFLATIFIVPIMVLIAVKGGNMDDDFFYRVGFPWEPIGVAFYDGGEEVYLTSSWDYFLTQIKSIATYLRLSFFPTRQNFYYHILPWHSIVEGKAAIFLMGYLSLIIVGIKLVLPSRAPKQDLHGLYDKGGENYYLSPPIRQKLIGAGILWFFIALIPTSSFMILWPFLSEFHLYLSLAGISFFWAGILLFPKRANCRRLMRILILISIFSFSLLAVKRNLVYSSSVSLWEDTVEKSPDLAPAHSNLAAAYIGRGEFRKAIEESKLAMSLNPRFNGYQNLRTAYRKIGNMAKADELVMEEIKRFPNNYRGYYEKALTMMTDNPGESAKFFKKAMEKNPPPEIRFRIEIILKRLGDE